MRTKLCRIIGPILLFIGATISSVHFVRAQVSTPVDVYDPTIRLRFARHLYKQGALQPAQLEALNISALVPTGPLHDSAVWLAALTHLSSNNFVEANALLAKLPASDTWLPWQRWGLGYQTLMMQPTDAQLPTNITAHEPSAALPGAYALLARQYTQYDSLQLLLGNGTARSAYQLFDKALETYKQKPKRNPFLASFLGFIIPGAGKAYLGQWGAALTTFLFTAAMGLQAWDGFRLHNQGLSWTFVAIGSLFHLSQAYTSGLNAIAWNRQREEHFNDDIWQALSLYVRGIYVLD